MFGVAVARLDQVSEEEKRRYQAFYCGLCRTLQQRYGQMSRSVLSYDLAFLAIFLDSLSEAPEAAGEARCPTHPVRKMPYLTSGNMAYAADLSVALAYHKVLDDVADDGTVRTHAAAAALRGAYERAEGHIPDACAAIARSMEGIRRLEADAATGPDACAQAFGALMGQLFAGGVRRASAGDTAWCIMWEQPAAAFGDALGRLIYLMDAAIDLRQDEKSGSYNPFVRLAIAPGEDGERLRALLLPLAADAAAAFERLPLVQDAQLMRAVLYAGVWQKFNQTYQPNV